MTVYFQVRSQNVTAVLQAAGLEMSFSEYTHTVGDPFKQSPSFIVFWVGRDSCKIIVYLSINSAMKCLPSPWT